MKSKPYVYKTFLKGKRTWIGKSSMIKNCEVTGDTYAEVINKIDKEEQCIMLDCIINNERIPLTTEFILGGRCCNNRFKRLMSYLNMRKSYDEIKNKLNLTIGNEKYKYVYTTNNTAKEYVYEMVEKIKEMERKL